MNVAVQLVPPVIKITLTSSSCKLDTAPVFDRIFLILKGRTKGDERTFGVGRKGAVYFSSYTKADASGNLS